MTLVSGGTDSMIKALPPMMEPAPIMVSPPKMEALE